MKREKWRVNDKEYGYLDLGFKEFTYNNIKYEYAFWGDNITIYTFLPNNRMVNIWMGEESYASLSIEELAGLLDIEY